MKKTSYSLIILAMLFCIKGNAQYRLEECQQKAWDNYPMIVQFGLLESSKEYNLENANKNYLPQISVSAKATYQSDVTSIPFNMPGINPLDKDQYSAVVQVDQILWDGGATLGQKRVIKAQSDVEKQKLKVDMYALKDRVNQLYFGIILINEQLAQMSILKKDLDRSYNQVSSYKDNGMANQSDLDAIDVERINTLQKETELLTNRDAFVSMLSAMTGENMKSDAVFEAPSDLNYSKEINRPELLYFDAQSAFLDSQKGIVDAKNRPKLGAFVQGGYGNPALNMLKNEFSTYYIAGLKLSWNLGNLYTKKNEQRIIDLNKKNVESQKNVFLYNSNLKSSQQLFSIKKLQTLIERDGQLIDLRSGIMKAAEAKLSAGTISVSELLREINLLDIVRNNRARHQVELIMAIYDLKNTTNN